MLNESFARQSSAKGEEEREKRARTRKKNERIIRQTERIAVYKRAEKQLGKRTHKTPRIFIHSFPRSKANRHRLFPLLTKIQG